MYLLRFQAYSALVLALMVGHAVVAAEYNEFVQGDLSNQGASPTALALQPAGNLVVGATSAMDPDFLSFTVPQGHVLSSVIIEFHSDANQVFFGLQAGSTWTAGSSGEIDPALMLGWVDFPTDPSTSHVGEDLLDDLGLAAGAMGFTPPLGSGTYTALFTAPSTSVSWALDFRVSLIGARQPGDFNGDQVVNGSDLAIWRDEFGDTLEGRDFLVWQRNLGSSPASAAAVPEPAASLLALSGLVGIMRRRRNARFYQ